MKAQYVLLLMLISGALGCYCGAQIFGLVPQPVKDLISWVDENTPILLVTLCFCIGCLTLLKIVGRRKLISALKKSEYSACQL